MLFLIYNMSSCRHLQNSKFSYVFSWEFERYCGPVIIWTVIPSIQASPSARWVLPGFDAREMSSWSETCRRLSLYVTKQFWFFIALTVLGTKAFRLVQDYSGNKNIRKGNLNLHCIDNGKLWIFRYSWSPAALIEYRIWAWVQSYTYLFVNYECVCVRMCDMQLVYSSSLFSETICFERLICVIQLESSDQSILKFRHVFKAGPWKSK